MDLISFGKYEGYLIEKTPSNYLEWMVDNLNGAWSDLAVIELEDRDYNNSHFYE
ncbi:MAG: putative quorum-sensing-regulated virulence factor [bacterium]